MEKKLWLIKKQRHYFANKCLYSQSYGFSSSHVQMWELDHKESWASKNWCFWTVVLEKTLESPLDCKEIKPVHPKGNQSRIFIGRTDAEAEAPILWPPDVKNWLIGKDPYAGKDWRREEKGSTEEEMVGWHHWLNGHEFEQTLGDGEEQGNLACYSPWGCKELDMTKWLYNRNSINWQVKVNFHTSHYLPPPCWVWSGKEDHIRFWKQRNPICFAHLCESCEFNILLTIHSPKLSLATIQV